MNDPAEREAMFWNPGDDNKVYCELCPNRCVLQDGLSGLCGFRKNIAGKLKPEGYAKISSIALDPVEKKPLYMFHPGSRILSVGGFGCNLKCPFCQNYEISSEFTGRLKNAERILPEQLYSLAKNTIKDDNIGVAYTYNEPLINYEYILDCAKLIRAGSLYNVLITNGYINNEPLEMLLPYIDAMNIDLKGFTEEFYKKLGGDPEPVKQTIVKAAKSCHVEVTTLVIPGENEREVLDTARWLSSVDSGIPLHLTRFFPRYKYSDRQPTPKETIFELIETAKKYLKNVFAGNIS